MIRSIWCKIIICTIPLLPAQEIKPNDNLIFERIDGRNGFSSDYVTGILQDHEGYMWFVTLDGLNRYDGYSIKQYKIRLNGEIYFESNVFDCIEVARNGELWLGTKYNGLYIFNTKTEKVTHISTDTTKELFINDNSIQDILCDSKGRVWISTYHGVSRYDPVKNRITIYKEDYNAPSKAPLGNVACIYEDSKGRILFGTWFYGLYIYDEERDGFKNIMIKQIDVKPSGNAALWSFVEDKYGYLWIGTWNAGLLQTRILNNSVQYIDHYYSEAKNPEKRITSNVVYSLRQAEDDAIWVGTSMGLNIITKPYEKEKKILYYMEGSSPQEISKSEVYDITQDVSGSIWLATLGGGVNKIDLKQYNFELFHIDNVGSGYKSQVVECFLPVSEDEFYLGVRTLGIGLYNFKERSFKSFLDLETFKGLPEDLNTVLCILKDSRSNLWLGTRYLGVWRKNADSGEWESIISRNFFSSAAPFSVNCLLEDKFNHIWIGTTEGLLKLTFNYEQARYNIDVYLNGPSQRNIQNGKNVTSLIVDSEQILWVATEDGGFYKLKSKLNDDSKLEFISYNNKSPELNLKNNTINAIAEDYRNRVWIGTSSNGIIFYDRKSKAFKSFPDIQELIGLSVYNIIPDESDILWLTTSKGLVRLSVDDEDINIQNFTSEDGLQSNIFLRGAWYKDNKGRIYLGGNYGINRFDPNEFRSNNFVPPVVITNFELNNKQAEIERMRGGRLVLQHTENSFSFTISALSYSQVRKNKFAYKLEGFDDDWIMTDYTNRNAVYTNIPPGKYRFLAKAANNSWIWNPEPVELSILIKPSPFLSGIAIAVYILLFFCLLYLFYSIRLKSLKAQQALEIEKIQRSKNEKINQFKLRFFTNISHELLTPLSIISYGITDISSNHTVDHTLLNSLSLNVKRLTTLINQILDFRKLETGNIKLKVAQVFPNNIFQNIHRQYLPYARYKKIDFSLNGSIREKVYLDEDKLRKILSNLLSNAFKYTNKNGKVVIAYNLIEDNKILNISIADTGIGINEKDLQLIFERFYQSNTTNSNNSGFGIGLHLVKNLVELHKGSVNVQNDTDGMNTVFNIKIPVYKSYYSKGEIMNADKQEVKAKLFEDEMDFFEDVIVPDKRIVHQNDKNFKILIVEDNNYIRSYLTNHISKYYTVIEASNGLKGYELACKENPDLIISDIIMPKMDGLELCKKIKNDINYSHIMVLLVTAKISNDDRSVGYLAGADSYLTKPLDMNLLMMRIDSLKKQRERIKDKYLIGITNINPQYKISPGNFNFSKQLFNAVLDNLGDPGLNVRMLAKKFNLSHSTLYRKIQSVTGISPNEFIRNVRLEEAAKLIENTDLNIAEIMVLVGFSDQSYFTKCFKRKFNTTPKEYIRNKDGGGK
jgi:signal transduction histidine kinase/ligand-binding sensor domain-containing protein/DNA-binding response OmpR family regulator